MAFKNMLDLVASSEGDDGGESPKAEKRQAAKMSPKAREFLDKIEQLESSGGKNTDHAVVKGGLNKGDRAVGRYGLMPKTIKDVARWAKMGKLKDMSPEDLARRVHDDPALEDQIAGALHDKLDKMHGGDEGAMARAWRMGIYDPKNKDPKEVDKHPYVKAFRKLSSPHDKRISSIVGDEQQTNDGTGPGAEEGDM